MKKTPETILKLFINHTPLHTQAYVQKNFQAANLDKLEDPAKISPLIHYMEALNKHKEYLEFFEIGVVRDERKKIENVAKYVGLAIRDPNEEYARVQKNKGKKMQPQQATTSGTLKNPGYSEFLESLVGEDLNKNHNKQEGEEHKLK